MIFNGYTDKPRSSRFAFHMFLFIDNRTQLRLVTYIRERERKREREKERERKRERERALLTNDKWN